MPNSPPCGLAAAVSLGFSAGVDFGAGFSSRGLALATGAGSGSGDVASAAAVGLLDLGLGRFWRLLCLGSVLRSPQRLRPAQAQAVRPVLARPAVSRPSPPRRALPRARQAPSPPPRASPQGPWRRWQARAEARASARSATVSDGTGAAHSLRLALGDLRRLWLRRRFQIGRRRLDLRLVSHRLGRFCRRLSAGAFRLCRRGWSRWIDGMIGALRCVGHGAGRRRIGGLRRRHLHCG